MSGTTIKMTPAEQSAKWQRNTKNAVSDMQAGVDRVSENPMDKAVASQDKMKARLLASIDSGRWAAGMKKVSLQDWKTKTKSKIGERLASGVDGAMGKRQAFDAAYRPVLEAGMSKVASMPSLTLQDGINRATAMITHLAQNKYKQ